MGNSLCERPDLDYAAGTIIPGRVWNRRRWALALPANTNVAVDTQVNSGVAYLRMLSVNAYAVQVYSNTAPASVQSLLVKFRRPTVAGVNLFFYLSSSGDNPNGSLGVIPTSGYGVAINAGNAPVLNKIASASASSLGASSGVNPSTAGQWYWLLLARTSGGVQFTIWQDGNTQPASPDVTSTDTSVAAGIAQICLNAGAGNEADFQAITVSQPGMNTPALPLTFKDLTGKRIPSGTATHTALDDGMNATQAAALTGTTSQDATNWRRIVSAAASSSTSVTMPAPAQNDVNALRATIRGLVSSSNQAQGFLGFVNGSNQIGIQQQSNNSGGTATIVLPASAGGNVNAAGFDWMGEASQGWNPNVTVELNLRNANPGYAGQLLVWAAEDALLYWVDLPTIASGAWTPTFTATALSSTAITLAYRQFEVDYESGSDW